MASVGAILAGGFDVVRRRPLAVLAWGVTYLVGLIVLGMILGTAMGGAMMAGMRQSQPPSFPSAGTVLLMFPLFYLGMLLLLCVIMNAAFRAVLMPEARSFASMRLGRDEFRALGLLLMFLIVGAVGYFILVLLLAFVGSAVGLASGGDPRVQGPFGILLMLGIFCGFIWLWVRLSLAFPLTLYRGRIVVDGAWDLSRGRFWPMFGAYFIMWALFIAALMAMVLPFILSVRQIAASLPPVAPGDSMPFQMQSQAFYSAMPGGAMLFGWSLIFLVVTIVGYALMFGTQASAARELLIERGEYPLVTAETHDGVLDPAPFDREDLPPSTLD